MPRSRGDPLRTLVQAQVAGLERAGSPAPEPEVQHISGLQGAVAGEKDGDPRTGLPQANLQSTLRG